MFNECKCEPHKKCHIVDCKKVLTSVCEWVEPCNCFEKFGGGFDDKGFDRKGFDKGCGCGCGCGRF